MKSKGTIEEVVNMTSKRIEEIQKETAYPESVSVMLALKKVWNECMQEGSYSKTAVDLLEKELLKEEYQSSQGLYVVDTKVIKRLFELFKKK